MVGPAPFAHKPVQQKHEVREEKQGAAQRQQSFEKAGTAREIGGGFAQHHGDDHGVADADAVEGGMREGEVGVEQHESQREGHRRGEEPKVPPLQRQGSAVGRHQKHMANGEQGCARHKAGIDGDVPQHGEHHAQTQKPIKAQVRLFRVPRVKKIDNAEKGKAGAGAAFEGIVEIVELIEIVQHAHGGGEGDVAPQHGAAIE